MSLDVVRSLLAAELGYSDETEITTDLSLFDDLQIDGNGYDQVIAELEERLDIEFEEEDLDDVETVGDLVTLITKLTEEED